MLMHLTAHRGSRTRLGRGVHQQFLQRVGDQLERRLTAFGKKSCCRCRGSRWSAGTPITNEQLRLGPCTQQAVGGRHQWHHPSSDDDVPGRVRRRRCSFSKESRSTAAPRRSRSSQFGAVSATSNQLAGYACVSGENGGETYYRLDVPVTGQVTVTLTPYGGDLDLIQLGADSAAGAHRPARARRVISVVRDPQDDHRQQRPGSDPLLRRRRADRDRRDLLQYDASTKQSAGASDVALGRALLVAVIASRPPRGPFDRRADAARAPAPRGGRARAAAPAGCTRASRPVHGDRARPQLEFTSAATAASTCGDREPRGRRCRCCTCGPGCSCHCCSRRRCRGGRERRCRPHRGGRPAPGWKCAYECGSRMPRTRYGT